MTSQREKLDLVGCVINQSVTHLLQIITAFVNILNGRSIRSNSINQTICSRVYT